MCNSIHREHQAIQAKGFGYKIFQVNGEACFADDLYRLTNGWICWDPKLGHYEDGGFCFFLTRKEAKRALDTWKANFVSSDVIAWSAVIDPADRVIRKIEYAGGICQQREDAMIDGITVTMALCKEWRLVPAKPRRV